MPLFNIVAIVSLIMSIICFLVFLLQTYLFRRPAAAPAVVETLDAARRQGVDPAKIAEAFAKLADSLAKAGPLVSSLVGAMFFMLVAVLALELGK
jgi:hypothetical protein